MEQLATTTGAGVTGGAVVVGGTVVAKSMVAYAIPTLMSTFATVVPGVGSLMPVWIGPLQAFAVAGTSVVSVPVALVVATSAVAYGAYSYFQ